MSHHERAGDGVLPAGPFASWLDEVEAAIEGAGSSDVPCDGCTACCTSSQFVHIAPDETETLAHIPRALHVPAPGLPRGHVLLGYDERGRCPMLVDDRCSIYEHRPRTCRAYDCRIFPATGVAVDPDQAAIARRARRWRFDHPTPADRSLHAAVRAAAAYLGEHPEALPEDEGVGLRAARRAVCAIEVHRAFLDADGHDPEPPAVRAELARRRGSATAR